MKLFTTQNKPFRKLLIALFWIFVWQIIYLWVQKDLVIPSPVHVAQKLYTVSFTKDFWFSIFVSFYKTFLGFFFALTIGTLLAFFTYFSKLLKELLSPILLIFKSAPIVSFILIALFFMKSDYIPILIAFIMSFPLALENSYTGLQNTNQKYLAMAKVYNYSKKDILKNIYIPTVIPYFIAASNLSIGFAWKSAISAELIATSRYGIGNEIYLAKLYLESETIIAWTIVVILLNIIFQKGFSYAVKKYHKVV